ncbi:hypothetical protein [Undibacterium jejuense]|uniref:hypothetical protein n=1 Tax=Undibacterium jejuense TaxID=1344949 RepID=UPI001C9BA8BE|nr:hypothetical protein [Undibacterium jejuense]
MHSPNYSPSVNESYFTRTSLDERIYALTGGSELLPITLLPRILGIAYQSAKNQISKGTFPIEIVKFGSKNYVRTEDLVRFIKNGETVLKKVGRKTNKERAALALAAKETNSQSSS